MMNMNFDEDLITSTSLEQVSQFYYIGNQMSQISLASDSPQGGEEEGEKKHTRRRRKKGKGTNDNGSVDQIAARKRKLSNEQAKMLEESFGNEHKLESERKDKLASQLGLDPRQVAVWFQNRRARWKTKKLEEQYSKLKNSHDQLLLDKCHLESEVINLKDKLGELDKAAMYLQQVSCSSNSPHSAVTMEAAGCMDEQGYNYEEDVFYVGENKDYSNGMEWVNNLNYYYI